MDKQNMNRRTFLSATAAGTLVATGTGVISRLDAEVAGQQQKLIAGFEKESAEAIEDAIPAAEMEIGYVDDAQVMKGGWPTIEEQGFLSHDELGHGGSHPSGWASGVESYAQPG